MEDKKSWLSEMMVLVPTLLAWSVFIYWVVATGVDHM